MIIFSSSFFSKDNAVISSGRYLLKSVGFFFEYSPRIFFSMFSTSSVWKDSISNSVS